MGNTSERSGKNRMEIPSKHICAGLLAHVDSGKTTLSEAILYESGQLRSLGRVDHRDAFLDTDSLERERGITIFSKQAVFPLGDYSVTLLDTPGHVDFSAEMERTLQVLDYAILLINGADGVQGHTETLWKLLQRYEIPTFLFVNKMDQPGTDRETVLAELQKRLDAGCIDFSGDAADADSDARELWTERVAMCDETLLEQYLEQGTVSVEGIGSLIQARKLFPCYFGSALKLQGVDALLEGLGRYMEMQTYGEDFSARVFKITRDEQGTRLTHMKITGGALRVRTSLGENEKINQIRIYSGARFQTVELAEAGMVCAVTGLSTSLAGQGLGEAAVGQKPMLQPVLNYRILPPEGCDIHQLYGKLKLLEEEAPELHILWDTQLNELHAHLMGEVQTEVLRELVAARIGVDISFGPGRILYQETIAASVEGVGHFEPLRHYAEVHLLLEPGEPGSGLVFAADCSEDTLDRNWQRLVLTHLAEREHPGVLTGSPITDMKITLVAGRAHQKHTEGGDFRQATYRALRQGLMKGECVLLEPVYAFRLELPAEMLGRAMSDIQRMQGSFETPEQQGELAVIIGEGPVVTMRDYQKEVIAYTRGRGRLFCSLKGYAPCHNAEEVIAELGYDPETDAEYPASSVFCSHGAGFTVPYDQVEQYMHVESGLKLGAARDAEEELTRSVGGGENPGRGGDSTWKEAGRYIGDKELEEIFVRTYGPIKERSAFAPQGSGKKSRSWNHAQRTDGNTGAEQDRQLQKKQPEEEAAGQPGAAENQVMSSDRDARKTGGFSGHKTALSRQKEYLLVDGYNIIFAWDELKALAADNLDGARGRLLDILSNYQGFTNKIVIAVFDAYRVQGHPTEELMYHNIHVVYTREAMTADQYIERLVHEIGRKHRVTVATSDQLEQIIIWGQGAIRMSAQGLWEEIQGVNTQIRREHLERQTREGNRLANYLPKLEEESAEED